MFHKNLSISLKASMGRKYWVNGQDNTVRLYLYIKESMLENCYDSYNPPLSHCGLVCRGLVMIRMSWGSWTEQNTWKICEKVLDNLINMPKLRHSGNREQIRGILPFLHFFWIVFVCSHVFWSPFFRVRIRDLMFVLGSQSDHPPFT